MALMDAYGPFDSGAGANLTEDRWRRFMRRMRGDSTSSRSGVIADAANGMQVYDDNTGMQVKVRTGEVWIEGHWGELSAEKTLSIATADTTNPRKDRIVARCDFVNNLIEVVALTGTPAGSPSAPAVTQDSTKWEISLAIVDIPANDTSISGQVTDDRKYLNLPGTSVSDTQNTVGTTTSSGAWVSTLSGGTACGVTFVAPSSGRVMIHNVSRVSNNGGSGSYASFRVRTGGTIGSGTDVVADDVNNACHNNTATEMTLNRAKLISGLTPGSTYNVQQRFIVDASTGKFEAKHLAVVPAA